MFTYIDADFYECEQSKLTIQSILFKYDYECIILINLKRIYYKIGILFFYITMSCKT